jgi:hypothetical protein
MSWSLRGLCCQRRYKKDAGHGTGAVAAAGGLVIEVAGPVAGEEEALGLTEPISECRPWSDAAYTEPVQPCASATWVASAAGFTAAAERSQRIPRACGRPLVDHETVVQLIGATRTTTGLRVRAKLNERAFAKGVEVTDEELAEVNLIREAFHGEWNYTIVPRRQRES